MVEISEENFEELVSEALDALPEDMVGGLDNVVFMVEDRNEDGQELLGLYEGFAVTDRGVYGYGEMPDRIIIYREAHAKICATLSELREEVHVTLVHEIAHYYGIDDDRLHDLGWG
ncbi:metallopeptidase family protein [Changpingibacter yushuensis]|uniref:metallopeptidase family protein n=1 Tax=Changpingibacter yushuensis TaxID=2758440 RepID=UPI00165EAD9A|nr:metallopeptidase family protein [Changpingibacter yushuensis]